MSYNTTQVSKATTTLQNNPSNNPSNNMLSASNMNITNNNTTTNKNRLSAQWIIVDGKLVCKWIVA